MVALGITSVIRMYPAIGWVRADKTSSIESLEENNALRRKNSELEDKIIKFNEFNPSSIHSTEKLAALDSTFDINLIASKDKKVLSTHTVSWSSILKSIASIVFNSLSEYQVMNEIFELCLKENNPSPFTRDFVLCPQDFNTIKIQFYALEFIELCYETDPDDGEYYSAWKATDKGKTAILNLVAIKAEDS